MSRIPEIRPATAADKPGLMALVADCGLFAPDELGLMDDMIEGWIAGEQAPPDHHWFVIPAANGIAGAGYLAADMMADRVFNLLFLAVRTEDRHQGLGAALIAHGETVAREAAGRLMLIETASEGSTAEARALYATLGYHVDGLIVGYYGDGVDKVIYRRTL